MAAEVEVIRDAWGIPHVFARTREDAWFAQGYVHAEDRLWQLVYDRFKAHGRASELVGESTLKQDVFVRRMGLAEAAERDLELLTPEERHVFERYADGVNAYLATGVRATELQLLDLEPDPWQAVDCLKVWKVRHVLMGSKGMKLWRARLLEALGPEAMARLASPDGREDLLIVPPGTTERWSAAGSGVRAAAEAFAEGSNSWALDGSRTASGFPIVAGDPHRMLEVPNVYTQMQLACDAFDVVGLTMSGVPGFPHFGHNGEVAWSITHAMADDQDLYLERFDDAGRALGPQGWEDVSHGREMIEIFGAEPLEIDVVRTPRGAVVIGGPGHEHAISIRWTGSDEPRRGLACLGTMLEATSAKQMDEAMSEWVVPCNTMLIGDRGGETRFLHRGRVPIRSRSNGWLPVPASSSDAQWRGDVPFEDLPRVVSPETGWIVTANNRVVAQHHPHYFATDYAAPNRAQRIVDRITALDNPADEAAMRAIHADTVSLATKSFADALREIPAPEDPLGRDAFALLADFDGDMRADDPAPTILDATRDAFLELVVAGDRLADLRNNPFPEEPLVHSPIARLRSALQRLLSPDHAEAAEAELYGGRVRTELLVEAFGVAVGRLADRLGPDPAQWSWGRVHQTDIRHPLARRFPGAGLSPDPVPVHGDGDTVSVSAAEIGYGVYHASVARYVFDLADRDRGGWVVPLGASAEPGSPHRLDQQALWVGCELIPIVSDRDRLRQQASVVQALTPAR